MVPNVTLIASAGSRMRLDTPLYPEQTSALSISRAHG